MHIPFKPLGKKAYGHIPHLPGSKLGIGDHTCAQGQADILLKNTRDKKDLIIVQVKLDGSNCSVAKLNGKILSLVRKGYLAETSPYEQHKYFSKWVEHESLRFDKLLKEGERVCGEWLLQAHGTRYNLKHEPFVPFDIMNANERFCYHDFLLRVLPLDFTIPHLVHIGQSFSIDNALKATKTPYHGEIDDTEGVVYRCERDGKVDFVSKFVRQDKDNGKYLPEINGGETIWNLDLGEFKKLYKI